MNSTTRRVLEVSVTHLLEVRKWLLENGAHEVELIDASETTWEKYCKSLAKSKGTK